jgi:hypothetical protein
MDCQTLFSWFTCPNQKIVHRSVEMQDWAAVFQTWFGAQKYMEAYLKKCKKFRDKRILFSMM